jgi:hypothetical protein
VIFTEVAVLRTHTEDLHVINEMIMNTCFPYNLELIMRCYSERYDVTMTENIEAGVLGGTTPHPGMVAASALPKSLKGERKRGHIQQYRAGVAAPTQQ